MSRTKDPNPHVTDFLTVQPKKNCVPDQHYVFWTPEVLKEYSYKRPRYDLYRSGRSLSSLYDPVKYVAPSGLVFMSSWNRTPFVRTSLVRTQDASSAACAARGCTCRARSG